MEAGERALRLRARAWLSKLAEAEAVARSLASRLGGATVILHGSYARGDFNAWSDVDLIVVSPAFQGVRFLDRLSGPTSLIPPGYEVIPWTPSEARAQLRRPTWRAALCRGYLILADTLGLRVLLEEATGCRPGSLEGLKRRLEALAR